jgi:hypothetical protein
MTRRELGEAMLNWHSGMNDPVYAVGSFYIDGRSYPKNDPNNLNVVYSALVSLRNDLSDFRKMDRGIPVMVSRGGRMVNLKGFAGYTRSTIRAHISELKEITTELAKFYEKDYS